MEKRACLPGKIFPGSLRPRCPYQRHRSRSRRNSCDQWQTAHQPLSVFCQHIHRTMKTIQYRTEHSPLVLAVYSGFAQLPLSMYLCSVLTLVCVYLAWLVGWSLTSLFSTNTAISETKGQGWRVIILPSEGRLAIY